MKKWDELQQDYYGKTYEISRRMRGVRMMKVWEKLEWDITNIVMPWYQSQMIYLHTFTIVIMDRKPERGHGSYESRNRINGRVIGQYGMNMGSSNQRCVSETSTEYHCKWNESAKDAWKKASEFQSVGGRVEHASGVDNKGIWLGIVLVVVKSVINVEREGGLKIIVIER